MSRFVQVPRFVAGLLLRLLPDDCLDTGTGIFSLLLALCGVLKSRGWTWIRHEWKIKGGVKISHMWNLQHNS